MRKLSIAKKAYIAGFLDGDGSVYVKLTKNKNYRYRYQVSSYIAFYQSQVNEIFLRDLKIQIGCGYLRKRNDGISELIIGDEKSQLAIIQSVLPFSKLKQKQLELMKEILEKKKKVKSAKDFLKLCYLIDRYKKLNYSKKRKQITTEVKKILQKEGLITP